MKRHLKIPFVMALALSAAIEAGPVLARNSSIPPPATIQPLPDGAPARSVSFAKVVVGMNIGQPYGVLKKGILCLPVETEYWKGGRSELDLQDFGQVFRQQLTSARYKVEGSTGSLFEDSEDTAAELAVAGEIIAVDGEFCYQLTDLHDYTDSKGTLRMVIRWEVYSRLDRKVVARIQTLGAAEVTKSTGNAQTEALIGAYAESVKALANNEEFRKLVLAGASTAGQPVSSSGLTPMAIHASQGKLAVPGTVGSVVAVFAGDGFGSGFVLGDGYLLTNRHVVGDASSVKVKWSDGLETVGEVVRSDARRDVALIKTDTRGRPCLTVRTDPVSLGDTVFAVGTPLDPKFQSTVTRGVVSATRVFDGFSYIQSDVTVNPGNSGGPLLDDGGRVVGMTVAGIRPGSAPSGINLFIPIRDAIDFLALSVSPTG